MDVGTVIGMLLSSYTTAVGGTIDEVVIHGSSRIVGFLIRILLRPLFILCFLLRNNHGFGLVVGIGSIIVVDNASICGCGSDADSCCCCSIIERLSSC